MRIGLLRCQIELGLSQRREATKWKTHPDRRQQFIETLEAVGGQALVGTRDDLNAQLRRLPVSSPPPHSAPSKTADIEQSLVIGAHGPRSLTVCFYEE